MVEYKKMKITPKLISRIRQSGKRSWFTITDDHDRSFSCFNKRLYDLFELGVPIKVELAIGKTTVISSVLGCQLSYPDPQMKAPKNQAEAEFFTLMKGHDWELTKKGWPDYACFKNGKLILIEVKPRRSHRLKYWQHKIMLELVKHGIRCYRWSPDGGFEPILRRVKFPIDLT
ncbi:hypothetical protein LCGC14_1439760 [marine sediment metagenome]|uniref:VRR-NUC domain-containing protein n=1 Tax=marine sediment metagenome TaxID=412755 RepID=A0A0F9MMZ6_9ZZZZ